jgi:putative copper export protein
VSPDTLSVLLRALSFAALLQAAGSAVFVAMFSRHLVRAGDEVRHLGAWSAAVALPLLGAQLVLEAARMAGEFAGVFDMSLQRMAFASGVGAAFAARVVALGLILVGLARGGRVAQLIGCAGSVLVAASFALMGHTAVRPDRWLLAPALIGHVFFIGLWFGGIPALYLVTLREAPDLAARIVEGFSRVAIWVVPSLAIAGALLALLLVRRLAVFGEPYGWLLLTKIAAFALLIGLGAANRLRLGPAVALGATRGLKRSLVAEYVLMLGVLGTTATMTSLYSPEP